MPLFIVRAKKPHGTVTYNCPTPEWALRKLRDFQMVGHADITVTGADGRSLVEADLVVMVEGDKCQISSAKTLVQVSGE